MPNPKRGKCRRHRSAAKRAIIGKSAIDSLWTVPRTGHSCPDFPRTERQQDGKKKGTFTHRCPRSRKAWNGTQKMAWNRVLWWKFYCFPSGRCVSVWFCNVFRTKVRIPEFLLFGCCTVPFILAHGPVRWYRHRIIFRIISTKKRCY